MLKFQLFTFILFTLLLNKSIFAQTFDVPIEELQELTKDISIKARTAINDLIKVDQTSDSAKRTKKLRRVMQKLDSETIRELFELYKKTSDGIAEGNSNNNNFE
uniref:Uncharacterized protein n=1 Tax=Panagrolaimus davidi TaxID=227884 RepID=A0A914PKU3_9BILA